MSQTREKFECPGKCGGVIFIEWGPGETERTVPCQNCYGQNWVPGVFEQVIVEEGKLWKKGDPVKLAKEQTSTTHGWKGVLRKGAGKAE